MDRKKRTIRPKNPINFQANERKELSVEERLEWLTEFWEKIGMNR